MNSMIVVAMPILFEWIQYDHPASSVVLGASVIILVLLRLFIRESAFLHKIPWLSFLEELNEHEKKQWGQWKWEQKKAIDFGLLLLSAILLLVSLPQANMVEIPEQPSVWADLVPFLVVTYVLLAIANVGQVAQIHEMDGLPEEEFCRLKRYVWTRTLLVVVPIVTLLLLSEFISL